MTDIIHNMTTPPAPNVLGLIKRPHEEALAGIQRLADYDLSNIRRDVGVKLGWSPRKCALVEREVKQFMALFFLDKGRAHSPTAEVDEFWHRMILHTRWYAGFCDAVFGTFFHHSIDVNRTAAVIDVKVRTKQLLAEWFEASKEKTEGAVRAQCNNDSNCNNEPSCNNDSNCNNEPPCNNDSNCNNNP
jgi:hypothetical protein